MRIANFFTMLMLCLLLTLSVGIGIRAADKKSEKVTDPALAQFIQNCKAYVQLRQKVEKTLPSLKNKASAAELRGHQKTLRAKMASERTGAVEGSVFTPQASTVLRKVLYSEMGGPAGKTERNAVLESSPKPFECVINSEYPSSEPLSTMPPDLLMRLPQLPDDLEYRFVQATLILTGCKGEHDR